MRADSPHFLPIKRAISMTNPISRTVFIMLYLLTSAYPHFKLPDCRVRSDFCS
nr:MAG TPA: hypothetical protein [Caudoviricetes sp.]